MYSHILSRRQPAIRTHSTKYVNSNVTSVVEQNLFYSPDPWLDLAKDGEYVALIIVYLTAQLRFSIQFIKNSL